MAAPHFKTVSAQRASLHRRAFDPVAIWLWFVAALVFAMIVVGGATRLTDSGLSITEWKPILGAIPPLSNADWLVAFEKYKAIPEYRLVNQGMALSDFKTIFWWEWSHRFLGRFIGLAFALPLIFFWLTKRLRPGQPLLFVGVLGLGALQGAIGWYMVSSGLAERIDVSQYRLALHLTVAFAILAILVWLALEQRTSDDNAPPTLAHSRLAAGIVGLTLLQVLLGAFVAGLKAGLVYNTWPDMNGQAIPSDYWMADRGLLSLFESHAAVQFNHRIGAYLLVGVVLVQLWQVMRTNRDSRAVLSIKVLAGMVLAQMAIGIATLLAHVPLHLGLLHQAGGALVLATAVWHLHTTLRADPTPVQA